MYPKSITVAILCFFSLLFSLSVQRVSAAPLVPAPRDVFDPTILSPATGTVWTIGSTQNVTWSTANAPKQITNQIGMVILAKSQMLFDDAPGGFPRAEEPLASGFDILLGRIEIIVPDVTPADDYEIVLFGDSGDISQEFTISN